MKTVSKKLLSLLLVVLLLAAAVPFQAFAEGTEYTVQITVRDADTDTELGVVDLPVSTESPASKTNINAKVAELMSGKTAEYPNGYSIDSYTPTAGSEPLTDWNVLPNDVKEVTVKVKTNTIPTSADITLTLNAGSGTIGSSGSTTTITITEKDSAGKYVVPTLPTASKSGYTFKGWFLDDSGARVENGSKLETSATATAQYELITYNLKVKGVRTNQSGSATVVHESYPTPGQNLLEYLRGNATDDVISHTPEGYEVEKSGDAILWYYYNGTDALQGQEKTTNAAQEVKVKYVPKTFTLYFQVDGGQVDPTSKTVTYDSKVGTLPIPTKSGKVFLGWFDEDGVQYTSETVYKVNGNTTLTARWQNESSVLLRIYLSPNTTTPDRIVDLTGKVNGNEVFRNEVWNKILTKYYQGSKMTALGLFSDDTWASFKAGSISDGSESVTVQENGDKTTNVYVVVKNATNKPNGSNSSSSSSGSSNSSSSTTKPADPDNPKTGDSMMIYAASAVMVLAAAALVTVQVLRKKRTY